MTDLKMNYLLNYFKINLQIPKKGCNIAFSYRCEDVGSLKIELTMNFTITS